MTRVIDSVGFNNFFNLFLCNYTTIKIDLCRKATKQIFLKKNHCEDNTKRVFVDVIKRML